MTRSLLALLFLAACGSLDATSRATQLQSPLCQGADAKAAFGSNAVCVCNDLNLVGAGFLAKSNASPANVGVNGQAMVVGQYDIGGSLIAMKGVTGVGDVRTGGSLSTTADVGGVGRVAVGGDLMVGGRIANVGKLDVAGTLGVLGEATLFGEQNIGKRGAYVAPAEPCGCGALAVDVAAKVAEARANGIRISDTTSIGDSKLTLGTGTYFAGSLASVGALELTIDGAVALAIDGDLQTVGRQHLELTPGSTLDLYVGGGLATVGDSLFGKSASPGSVRVFLGGEALSVGAQTFNASIYAPRSDLSLVGDTVIAGSVFARSIGGVGRLTVDYAAPTGAAPERCVVADAPKGGGPGAGDSVEPL